MFTLLFCACALASVALAAVVFSEDVQVSAGAVNVPTTAETLVTVGASLSLPSGNAKAVIRGWVDFTVGAGANSVVMAVYSGNAIGGRLIGSKLVNSGNFTPGDTAHFELEVVDVLSNVGGAQYCMSVQQGAATADGTVLAALLDTTLLSG